MKLNAILELLKMTLVPLFPQIFLYNISGASESIEP